eukprot:TRINITY_DN39453_c0_g1_i1.p1 TRINITY_DN39453_c0_g1~~TRINITY_DN39453_c0_g1_i1.p1  ORF type:complete len:240 (+),score=32.78 TRINITY_DN39453_c0_g1_i1:65-721(+)
MAAAAATFQAIDADHEGVSHQQEFAAQGRDALIVVAEQPVAADQQPEVVIEQTTVTEYRAVLTAPPIVLQYAQPRSASIAPPSYVYAAARVPASEHPFISLSGGTRIVYTSRSNGRKYPGTVLRRIPGGYVIKLDVDGGLKEVEDIELWRVEPASDVTEEEEVLATPVEEKAPATPVSGKFNGAKRVSFSAKEASISEFEVREEPGKLSVVSLMGHVI